VGGGGLVPAAEARFVRPQQGGSVNGTIVRTFHALLGAFILLVLACRAGAGQTESPDVDRSSHVAVGCWRLSADGASPWLDTAALVGLDSAAVQDRYVPAGPHRVVPGPGIGRPAWRGRVAVWQQDTGSDSIAVTVGDGFGGVRMRLVASGDSAVYGTAHSFTDTGRQSPEQRVSGTRIECPATWRPPPARR